MEVLRAMVLTRTSDAQAIALQRTGRIGTFASAVSRLLHISLTFDHRVVTGSEATRFLTLLITDLETTS